MRTDTRDFRLTDGSGQPFGSYPYFILSIERSVQRPDWMLIPDLKTTWDAIRQAFVGGQYNDAGNLLSQFERQCRVSPDLVPADAKRLAKKARDAFAAPKTQTFEATKRGPLPEFRGLDLYG